MSDGRIINRFREITRHEPYPFQVDAWKRISEGKNVIIAAGTGSGKTEAVLLPAMEEKNRIILCYPTKALLQDQISRVVTCWRSLHAGCSEEAAKKHISVDTGDDNDSTRFRADVILTTIDKLLYRIFGYGSGRWGYIYPWRIALSKQQNTLLVFDEAHAYDEIPLTHFLFIIDKLTYRERVQTAVLSATLPKDLVNHLRDASRQSFPRDPNREGEDFFSLIEEGGGTIRRGVSTYEGHLSFDDAINRALERYRGGDQVIIVANRVYAASDSNVPSVQTFWEQLKDRLNEGEQKDLLLYHGHQFPSQRRYFLEKLKRRDSERRDGNKTPYILITTSAFEVGVDVSCDVMLTEICSPDAFIQRIGRCARRCTNGSPETGIVYTFGDIVSGREVASEEIHSQERLSEYLSEITCQQITDDVKSRINSLNVLDDTLLRRRRNTITYTADAALYDYVYDFVATGVEFWKKGVLVTRSWVPTIEIQLAGEDSDERLRLPLHYRVPDDLVEAWWLEICDEDGRPIRAYGQRLGDQLRAAGIEAYERENRLYVNGYQSTLVLLLKADGYDEDFGLRVREYVPPKSERVGLGLYRKSARVFRDTPCIFWFEPAAGEEA